MKHLACLLVFAVGGAAWAQVGTKAEVHYKSGVALKEQGKVDEAIGQFELAVVENPKHPMAWNSLGILYKKKGEHAKAVQAFEKAVELMPSDANARSNL